MAQVETTKVFSSVPHGAPQGDRRARGSRAYTGVARASLRLLKWAARSAPLQTTGSDVPPCGELGARYYSLDFLRGAGSGGSRQDAGVSGAASWGTGRRVPGQTARRGPPRPSGIWQGHARGKDGFTV